MNTQPFIAAETDVPTDLGIALYPAERVVLHVNLDAPEAGPPFYQCDKGHTEPAVGLRLQYGQGPDAKREDYCLRCFAEHLSRTKKVT